MSTRPDSLINYQTAEAGHRAAALQDDLRVTLAAVVVVLALASYTAAAQTERATALIEQAFALRGDVSSGAALYESLCVSCHGAQAYGNAATVTPSLAGQLPVYLIKQLVDVAEGDRVMPEIHVSSHPLQRQHYSYLLMQSRRLAVGHRYSVPVEVIEVLEELPFDQLTAIADYASRLPDGTIGAGGAEPMERR